MGVLYLVSTPIGNVEDISLRAVKTLFSVDCVLCEDTRKTGMLLQRLEEKFPQLETRKPCFLSFYDQNEERRIPQAIKLLKENNNLALVSSAGTPLISDPGFKLVRECLKQGMNLEVIPGPSAVTSALAISGFPTDKFLFLGFLPKKLGKRKKLLQNLSKSIRIALGGMTLVVFESPYRLLKTLQDIREELGDVEIAICRELTKMHEEIRREKVSEAIRHFENNKPRGEFTIIIRV